MAHGIAYSECNPALVLAVSKQPGVVRCQYIRLVTVSDDFSTSVRCRCTVSDVELWTA